MLRIFGHYISPWKILLLLGDTIIFCLSLLIALFFNPKTGENPFGLLVTYKMSFLLIAMVYLLILFIADLYNYQSDFRNLNEIGRIVNGILTGTLVVIILFYFPFGHFVGRTLLIILASIFTVLLLSWRLTFSALALPQRLQKKLLIVGAGSCGRYILEEIRRQPRSGLTVMGFVDDDPQKVGSNIGGLPVLGLSANLPKLTAKNGIDLVVVAITHEKSPELLNNLAKISFGWCQVIDMPTLYEFLTQKVPVEHISDLWFYLSSLQAHKKYYNHLKRFIDLFIAVLVLATTWPIFIFLMLAIKLESRGPCFYRQERLGQGGRSFQIIKFRTMEENAEHFGPQWTSANDSRITKLGRVLRKFHLDELPQVLNILRGEMSFIGPRPERENFIREFQTLQPILRPGRRTDDPPGSMVQSGFMEKIPFYSFRLLVKPGITGWAQVNCPYASSLEQTQEKLKYDLFYIKNLGGFLDLVIFLKTLRIVLFGHGI